MLIILRHLPEAIATQTQAKQAGVEKNLEQKGLPAVAISRLRTALKLSSKKLWNFVLEAKDLKPAAIAGYKIKKIFNARAQNITYVPVTPVAAPPKQPTENDLLEAIKGDPHNLTLYQNLGKHYMDAENYADAKDVYGYLTKHAPADSDFHGKLAYCCYQLKDYTKAVEHYKISLTLDSSQPTRYYNLGLSQEAVGNTVQAIEAFRHAVLLEPQTIKTYISLSNLYIKSGDRQKAQEILLEAKKVDPGNEQVKTKLKQLN